MSDKQLLDVSYEDSTVTPTPGSPVGEGTQNTDMEAAPKDKITFYVHIVYKDQVTKKAVRILPQQSMHDFIDKLTKKKYMPSISALGGVPLKSDHISISFGRDNTYTVPLMMNRWAEPLWDIGFREKVQQAIILPNCSCTL